jgi:hypothetical protein
MKRTRCSGRTCVGDVRLSALDVGFDLRLHDIAVNIPDWPFASVGLDQHGATWLVEGTREELIAAIQEAGYRVEVS